MQLNFLKSPYTKIVVFICSLAPALLTGITLSQSTIADPAKLLVDNAGIWALRFLWLSLLMTPLHILSKDSGFIRYRRMLGLFAFFYASIHVLAYWFLLFGAQWQWSWQEIQDRPYIMVGSLAYILLIPLAISSTHRIRRYLKRHWFTLHKAIYLIAPLILLHFTWVKKLGIEATAFYAIALAGMFAIRIWHHYFHKNTNAKS